MAVACSVVFVAPATAATINITGVRVNVGVTSNVGYGPVTLTESDVDDSTGGGVATADLVSSESGFFPPDTFNSAGVTTQAMSFVNIENGLGITSPRIAGSWEGAISFFGMVNGGVAGGFLMSSDNSIEYLFDVVGGPVDYTLIYSTDVFSFLSITRIGGTPVESIAASGMATGTLAAGSYRLFAFSTLSSTHLAGNAAGSTTF